MGPKTEIPGLNTEFVMREAIKVPYLPGQLPILNQWKGYCFYCFNMYKDMCINCCRYSSVEMLSLSRKRRSMGDREPARIPPGRPEHDIDDFQQGELFSLNSAPPRILGQRGAR